MLTAHGERASTISDAFGQTHRVARVNLLPPEILQARRFKRTQGLLAAAVVGVLAVVGGAYALQAHQAQQAEQQLATSRATGVALRNEQARYADVPRVYAAIDGAQAARQTAMGQDVQWYRYLTDLSLAIPKDVFLTSLTVSSAGGPAAAGAESGVNPLATAGIGQVSFAGTAFKHDDVAAWLDMLAKEKGFADPYFSNSTAAKIGKTDVVNFTSTATVTADALSHRFDRKAG